MRKGMVLLVLAAFLTNTFVPYAHAQQALALPAIGARVELSPAFTPALLKGIKVYPNDPFRLDFILDRGTPLRELPEFHTSERNSVSGTPGVPTVDTHRLIKYFLASLTVPENDLWVNLSPYEKDRIVPEAFGQTEMGRDLLAQDYILKQITATLLYPEGETGKSFWARVYQQAQDKFGTTDIPVDTFNKVWIVPTKATVFENKDAAFVTEAAFKVMLESDYLAGARHPEAQSAEGSQHFSGRADDTSKQILREIVIPVLEKEVNEGKNFAPLRQVYHSLILATWFKEKVKETVLGKAYVDRQKTAGIEISDKAEKEKIWAQYVASFKKGVFDLVKEERDPVTDEMVPRKYFSGGLGLHIKRTGVFRTLDDAASLPKDFSIDNASIVEMQGEPMGSSGRQEDLKEDRQEKGIKAGFAMRIEYDPLEGTLNLDGGPKVMKKGRGAQKTASPLPTGQNDIFDQGDAIIRIYREAGVSREAEARIFQDFAKDDISPQVIAHGFIQDDPQGYYFIMVEKITGDTFEERVNGQGLSDDEMKMFLFFFKKLIDRKYYMPDFTFEQIMVGQKGSGSKGIWLVDPEQVEYGEEHEASGQVYPFTKVDVGQKYYERLFSSKRGNLWPLLDADGRIKKFLQKMIIVHQLENAPGGALGELDLVYLTWALTRTDVEAVLAELLDDGIITVKSQVDGVKVYALMPDHDSSFERSEGLRDKAEVLGQHIVDAAEGARYFVKFDETAIAARTREAESIIARISQAYPLIDKDFNLMPAGSGDSILLSLYHSAQYAVRRLATGKTHGTRDAFYKGRARLTVFLDEVFRRAGLHGNVPGAVKVLFLRAGAEPLYAAARLMARVTGVFPEKYLYNVWATMAHAQTFANEKGQPELFVKYLYDQGILSPDTRELLIVDTDTGLAGPGTELIFARSLLDDHVIDRANARFGLRLPYFNAGHGSVDVDMLFMHCEYEKRKYDLHQYYKLLGVANPERISVSGPAESLTAYEDISSLALVIDHFPKIENVDERFILQGNRVMLPRVPVYDQEFKGRELAAVRAVKYAGLEMGVLDVLEARGYEIAPEVARVMSGLEGLIDHAEHPNDDILLIDPGQTQGSVITAPLSYQELLDRYAASKQAANVIGVESVGDVFSSDGFTVGTTNTRGLNLLAEDLLKYVLDHRQGPMRVNDLGPGAGYETGQIYRIIEKAAEAGRAGKVSIDIVSEQRMPPNFLPKKQFDQIVQSIGEFVDKVGKDDLQGLKEFIRASWKGGPERKFEALDREQIVRLLSRSSDKMPVALVLALQSKGKEYETFDILDEPFIDRQYVGDFGTYDVPDKYAFIYENVGPLWYASPENRPAMLKKIMGMLDEDGIFLSRKVDPDLLKEVFGGDQALDGYAAFMTRGSGAVIIRKTHPLYGRIIAGLQPADSICLDVYDVRGLEWTGTLADILRADNAEHPNDDVPSGVEVIAGGRQGILAQANAPLQMINEDGMVQAGAVGYDEAHAKGVWHMVSHIYLIDPQGRLLLQVRSQKKKTSPGKLQVSVSGHVDAHEDPLGAAQREGEEEAGFKIDAAKLVNVSGDNAIKRSARAEGGVNNEFATVYVYRMNEDEMTALRSNYNLNEVDAFWAMDFNVFEALVNADPEMKEGAQRFAGSVKHLYFENRAVYDAMKAAAQADRSQVVDDLVAAAVRAMPLAGDRTPDWRMFNLAVERLGREPGVEVAVLGGRFSGSEQASIAHKVVQDDYIFGVNAHVLGFKDLKAREAIFLRNLLDNVVLQHVPDGVALVVREKHKGYDKVSVIDKGRGFLDQNNKPVPIARAVAFGGSFGRDGTNGIGLTQALRHGADFTLIDEPREWAVIERTDGGGDFKIINNGTHSGREGTAIEGYFLTGSKLFKPFVQRKVRKALTASGASSAGYVKRILAETLSGHLDHAEDAAESGPGGIDLTRGKLPLHVESTGSGASFNFDPAMVTRIQDAAGFRPVILGIHPMTMSLPTFLGLSNNSPASEVAMR